MCVCLAYELRQLNACVLSIYHVAVYYMCAWLSASDSLLCVCSWQSTCDSLFVYMCAWHSISVSLLCCI